MYWIIDIAVREHFFDACRLLFVHSSLLLCRGNGLGDGPEIEVPIGNVHGVVGRSVTLDSKVFGE